MNSFSRLSYERYLYTLEQVYTEIRSSSVHLYTVSRQAAQVRGSIWFHNELELRVFELVDLTDGEVLDYSYTVFFQNERVRWYDPQPHPEVPELAATFLTIDMSHQILSIIAVLHQGSVFKLLIFQP